MVMIMNVEERPRWLDTIDNDTRAASVCVRDVEDTSGPTKK